MNRGGTAGHVTFISFFLSVIFKHFFKRHKGLRKVFPLVFSLLEKVAWQKFMRKRSHELLGLLPGFEYEEKESCSND